MSPIRRGSQIVAIRFGEFDISGASRTRFWRPAPTQNCGGELGAYWLIGGSRRGYPAGRRLVARELRDADDLLLPLLAEECSLGLSIFERWDLWFGRVGDCGGCGRGVWVRRSFEFQEFIWGQSLEVWITRRICTISGSTPWTPLFLPRRPRWGGDFRECAASYSLRTEGCIKVGW